jgi:hypothetical protein
VNEEALAHWRAVAPKTNTIYVKKCGTLKIPAIIIYINFGLKLSSKKDRDGHFISSNQANKILNVKKQKT